jgi:cell division protein FtsB
MLNDLFANFEVVLACHAATTEQQNQDIAQLSQTNKQQKDEIEALKQSERVWEDK